MRTARWVAALAAAVLAVVLSACVPTPAPTPTTTGFASEEEAFAAAEATYRAYVDALNDVDLSDPATFEPLYTLTTGDANEAARVTFSQMHADGWVVEGPTVLALLERATSPSLSESARLAVCVDVSEVEVVDSTGTSVVAVDRKDVQPMLITLEPSWAADHGWLIKRIEGRDGSPECSSG